MTYDEAIYQLENLPKLQLVGKPLNVEGIIALLKKDMWHYVDKEGKPTKGGHYQVYYKNIGHRIDIFNERSGNFFYEGAGEGSGLVKWRELPENE